MSIKPLDFATAGRILDLSGGDKNLAGLGKLQLEGAVALHNMIADPGIGMAYLADEVGMGKTYIALGVVALLRYFNPSLRVLYICPSMNVQEKWYNREYRSFTKHNVRVGQFRIRTPEGRPAAPRVNCRNVPELIRSASSGYYADYFVGKGAFSLSLNEDDAQWQNKLSELKAILPAYTLRSAIQTKWDVKEQYARALNYILPTFDLVIIDEAHNFKHDFESSDRNRVLSAVLGFRDQGIYAPRVKHALLLSATPYDRNLEQLRNQLRLVGKSDLLPEDIEDSEQDRVRARLSRFMVRRLNKLTIAGKAHTRNMYRKEWRSGERAEIALYSDEQKLVTALVQKKVGEMLDRKTGSPSFQTGLLASFESYAESTRSQPVEFDGDASEKDINDAEDRHVVGAIADSFTRANLGTTLPHPKMDAVTTLLAHQMFDLGRKQILFVRRVKSVKEIKDKLDDLYNKWLADYIRKQLDGHPTAATLMESVISEYFHQSRRKDADVSGGDYLARMAGEAEDHQPPKNDTFFAWFFRGELDKKALGVMQQAGSDYTTPDAMRIGLAAKNQALSALMEINWARVICAEYGEDLLQLCDRFGEEIAGSAIKCSAGVDATDQLGIFQACQLGFLLWYQSRNKLPGLNKLIGHLRPTGAPGKHLSISLKRVREYLDTYAVFDALEHAGLSEDLFPILERVKQTLLRDKKSDIELLQTLDIQQMLFAQCLRTGHGVIDLYLSRLRRGTAKLTPETRANWMQDLANNLKQQSKTIGFSTYAELHNLAQHMDLIIKTNLSDVYDKSPEEYRKYLSQMLNPVAPVIGAHGVTVGSRSAQARKFRMPGYPLALITTDVFQEGEDLHTFCDSVTHYGLPSSPVSIEQKTGRVDRVASQAQRRLLQIADESDITDDTLIQVTFPFVKESIEVLQVRRLCKNINEFIASLHDIGTSPLEAQDVIDTHTELQDRSPIPEQILTLLRSPYEPKVMRRVPKHNREQFVDEQGSHVQRITRHVERLLTPHFGAKALSRKGLTLVFPDNTERSIALRLISARASGEMLLAAAIKSEEISLAGLSRKQFLKRTHELSWCTFHRTYTKETANRCYQLYHDAELLIGDENQTTSSEISRFLERFTSDHDPSSYLKPQAAHIRRYWQRAARETKAQYGQWHAEILPFEQRGCLGLTFHLTETTWRRRHRIKIYEADGRCVFMAKAADASAVSDFSIEQLVRFTWQRNANIDIVEFMLDDEGHLMGRAIHPSDGLTFKEFMYCAYTLAVATDRLEYLVQEPDVH